MGWQWVFPQRRLSKTAQRRTRRHHALDQRWRGQSKLFSD
jgi:hypothetical protein